MSEDTPHDHAASAPELSDLNPDLNGLGILSAASVQAAIEAYFVALSAGYSDFYEDPEAKAATVASGIASLLPFPDPRNPAEVLHNVAAVLPALPAYNSILADLVDDLRGRVSTLEEA